MLIFPYDSVIAQLYVTQKNRYYFFDAIKLFNLFVRNIALQHKQ